MAERTPSRSAAQPATRLAVLTLHTSPTADLGRSANGGLNVYVRETCAAFGRQGIACDVFTRTAADKKVQVEHLGPCCRIVYLPTGLATASKYDLLAHTEAFGEAVDAWARAEEICYDLVHSHYWLSGAAARRLRELRSMPWVHTAHTLALVKNRQLAEGATPEPPDRIRIEREIAAQADRLVASTEDEAEDWTWTYGGRADRVRVVPPGVDLATFRPRPRAAARARIAQIDDAPLILFVGRLERLKGVEVLLRALAIVNDGRSNPARLLVIGEDSRDADESEEQRLRALAGALGLGDQVEFVGSVPHTQLPHYYAAANICVMPSYSESFGLVALEAQASGCPVVASDVSGLRSVVRNDVTGFLVAGHEPAAYALRLRVLLDDKDLAQQMGRRGTLLAQRFTWARTAERLLDVYSDLLEPAQAGVHSGSLQE